jgi:hypothetical protein
MLSKGLIFFILFTFSFSSFCHERLKGLYPNLSSKLYISTGLCYSGTGFTPPAITDVGKILSRLDIDTRQYEVVRDYRNLADEEPNTYPNGITDGGDGFIYVAVDNPGVSGARRIDKIEKAALGTQIIWQPNSTALAANTLRGIARAADNEVLVGNTLGVERFDSKRTRKEVDLGVAWGGGNAGSCASNNTRITDLVALPKAVASDKLGKFIYAHAALGQMDIGVISKNGSNLAARCLANAPGGAKLVEAKSADSSFDETLSANATPTSLVFIRTGAGKGKLLVAYSSSSKNENTLGALNNALVMYDFKENTTSGESASLTYGTVLYNNTSYFFGVTAMAYDSTKRILYVASAESLSTEPTGYNIERFLINLTTPSATRLTDSDNSPFEESNSFTNCVTGMFIGR